MLPQPTDVAAYSLKKIRCASVVGDGLVWDIRLKVLNTHMLRAIKYS